MIRRFVCFCGLWLLLFLPAANNVFICVHPVVEVRCPPQHRAEDGFATTVIVNRVDEIKNSEEWKRLK